MSEPLPLVQVWCDGGCWPNPGPGGWGAVIVEGGIRREIRGRSEVTTTNNRMELMAAIMALQSLSQPSRVIVTTDSQYLKNGTQAWMYHWEAKGWRGVKNADLWMAIYKLCQKHEIRWRWVRGHATCAENNRADALAERT